MINHRYTITSDATQEIEFLIARFERERVLGPVALEDYLPPSDATEFGAVVTELARIDLEYRFNEGNAPDAGVYLHQFPDIFADAHHRTQLAFEEFRLRRRSGEDVSGVVVGERYDVDGSRWPKMKLGNGKKGLGASVSRRFSKQDLAAPNVCYPRIGDSFAGYSLVERIGEGAFSRVFLARQPDLASRLVVLKVTPLETTEPDQLARLQHSSIIPVYSIHREGDLSCICMPFLGATTLADLSGRAQRWASLDGPAEELVSTILDRRRSTTRTDLNDSSVQPSRTTEILDEGNQNSDETADPIADSPNELAHYTKLGYVGALIELVTRSVEGIAYAHRRGIIHRDLKPANILVADDGSPIVLDFNLAVSGSDPTTQIVGGTLPYMSPQQLESLQTTVPADQRDDVFSIGVILYELLSGQLPFACPGSGEAFDLDKVVADRTKTPGSIRELNPRVSPGLESIIERCLQAQPRNRYGDAGELLEDLNLHRQNLPLRFAPNRSIHESITKWSRRHPRLASGTSVASIAAILLLASSMLIWQRNERISILAVESQYQSWQSELPNTIAALSTPGKEPELLRHGLGKASRMMKRWNVEADNWKSLAEINRLGLDEQKNLNRQLAKLAYMMASAEYRIALQTSEEKPPGFPVNAERWNRLVAKLDPSLSSLASLQQDQISKKLDRIRPNEQLMHEFANANSDNLDARAMLAAYSGDAILWRQLTEEQLDDQPTNATHWFDLALANGLLGDLDGAAACFNVANRIQPNSIATLFNRGLCRLEQREYRFAFSDFSKCLNIDPQMTAALSNRALASFGLNDYGSALEDLNQIVAQGRPSTRIFLLRARVHLAMGNAKLADADRLAATNIEPRDADDWIARGVSLLNDAPDAALADFESALRIRPNDVKALNNAAHTYTERLHDPKLAIEMLSRLIDIRPNQASAIASRGILHARVHNWKLAMADAKLAGKLDPSAREQLQIAGIHAMLIDTQHSDDPDRPDNKPLSQATHREEAIKWLARALKTDTKLARIARDDTDLTNIVDDPRFVRMVESGIAIEAMGQPATR